MLLTLLDGDQDHLPYPLGGSTPPPVLSLRGLPRRPPAGWRRRVPSHPVLTSHLPDSSSADNVECGEVGSGEREHRDKPIAMQRPPRVKSRDSEPCARGGAFLQLDVAIRRTSGELRGRLGDSLFILRSIDIHTQQRQQLVCVTTSAIPYRDSASSLTPFSKSTLAPRTR